MIGTLARPEWDEYLMGFAEQAATRGSCDRKQVGAAIAIGRRVLATGYNGSIPGTPSCQEIGHDMDNGHCVRTVHAEMNALTQAAKYGIAVEGATMYSTTETCWPCFRVLVAAGIVRFVFRDEYNHDGHRQRIYQVTQHLTEHGHTIQIKRLEGPEPCKHCQADPSDPMMAARERSANGLPPLGMCCEWSRVQLARKLLSKS